MSDDLNPNPETALSEAILATRQAKEGARETFWASSLGMCPRKLISERAGIPSVFPPDLRSTFKMWVGTALGKQIQELLTAQGFLDPAWTEKRVTYRSFSGKVDGYTNRINGGAIVEIKTADDRAVAKHDLPEHYLWQTLFYCLATGVNTACILMIGKNQGLTKHRIVTLDDEAKERLEREIFTLEDLWDQYTLHGIVPACSHRFGWEDSYCPYREAPAEAVPTLKES